MWEGCEKTIYKIKRKKEKRKKVKRKRSNDGPKTQEKCSGSFIIGEMQIKAISRCHFPHTYSVGEAVWKQVHSYIANGNADWSGTKRDF